MSNLPKFAIFSTELGPMLDPRDEYDALVSLVFLDRDPIATGSYNPYAGSEMRGTVIPTLGGVVVQDFGRQIQDQRISISDEAAISLATRTALITLYEISSGVYYFTDGYECWEVQFVRPNGLITRRNLMTSFFNRPMFDYEINLVVKDKENVG